MSVREEAGASELHSERDVRNEVTSTFIIEFYIIQYSLKPFLSQHLQHFYPEVIINGFEFFAYLHIDLVHMR